MKIALLADLHANGPALRAIAAELESAELLVVCGDFVGYYMDVNEVLDFFRLRPTLAVRGNHDHFALTHAHSDINTAVGFGVDWARRTISESNRRWLRDLPMVWEGEVDGLRLLLSHGSPWRPMSDYIYADSPLLADLQRFDADVVAFGQTHRAFIEKSEGQWLVNPGSVGQPRDIRCSASFAWLDTATGAVSLVRREFDPTSVLQQAIDAGAGAWIYKHLS